LWSIFAVSRLEDADGPWALLGLEEQVPLANSGGRLEKVCRAVKRPVAASQSNKTMLELSSWMEYSQRPLG
jgi:hypothetical protein